jgi:hypothetical protein
VHSDDRACAQACGNSVLRSQGHFSHRARPVKAAPRLRAATLRVTRVPRDAAPGGVGISPPGATILVFSRLRTNPRSRRIRSKSRSARLSSLSLTVGITKASAQRMMGQPMVVISLSTGCR